MTLKSQNVALPTVATELLESVRRVHEAMRPTSEAIDRINKAMEPTFTAMAKFDQAMRPMTSVVEEINKALRPTLHAVEQWHRSTFGVLEHLQIALRPALLSGWAQAVAARFEAVDQALVNAEAMGRAGWTVPLNAGLPECMALLRASVDAEAADRAFVAFYTADDGVRRAELIADLLSRPELQEWVDLLKEVVFAVEAGKYRLAVPALLSAFEGVANRSWSASFYKKAGRSAFFRQKLKSLERGSYDHIMWCSARAFVAGLYRDEGRTKPATLNRHWVLHGRGPAAGAFADCLRLLQAMHTALSIAERPAATTGAT